MKYYKLTYSINNKEVGCFPQSETAENYSFIQSNLSILDINPIPVLKSKAKLTSLLFSVPISAPKLIIDDNFLNFLKPYLRDEYLTSKIKIRKGSKFYENYNLFILKEISDQIIINFEKSIFYEGSNTDWQYIGDVVEIDNYNDYLNHIRRENNNDYFLKIKSLNVNFSNVEKDLILVGQIPLIAGYLVSERLKNAIENERFTGFAFQEIEEMDKRIKVIY